MKARVPTSPEPPARLSTTTCWPSAPVSFSATPPPMATPPAGRIRPNQREGLRRKALGGCAGNAERRRCAAANAKRDRDGRRGPPPTLHHSLPVTLSLAHRVPPPLGTAAGPQRRAPRM